jgi:organic radical activating enzyme
MIHSIEPAIDPNARPTFLLDWELTMKCNLDCSYCTTGHDNSTQHPPLSECLKSIDFMYAYADLYMARKPKWSRHVVLNVYGGESLIHPDIVEILQQVKKKHEPYQDRWSLKITNTTNAVIGKNRFSEIVGLIDEFTVSYHAETLAKQKTQILENIKFIKQSGTDLKVIVLMHGNKTHWQELLDVIDFCRNNQVRYLAKQIDGKINSNYDSQQVLWFRQQWKQSSPSKGQAKQADIIDVDKISDDSVNLASVGRACCGGRLLCTNQELKSPIFFIPNNNFHGWSCSVNWFFLFVKQLTGEIFVNKDCQMNFDGTVSPIGHLDNYQDLLTNTSRMLQDDHVPLMTCAKSRCVCGLCAPKSKEQKDLLSIMQKHQISS